jgi:CheY-like chemotaxis protein
MKSLNPDQNRRILVIDDNPSIHDDFRKILSPIESTSSALSLTETQLFGNPLSKDRPFRYQVDSAAQGQVGVAMIKKAFEAGRPYALAFVDIQMPPGWDGVETTMAIWEIEPEIQIVICSAYSAYSWQEMFEIVGQNDRTTLLNKPFDPVEVQQLTKLLTEKWRVIHFKLKTTQSPES